MVLRRARRLVLRIGRWLTSRLWQVHPTVMLTVHASPDVCLQALARAAKPSQHRLEFRNLFTDGRRYYVQWRDGGFKLTSNSKLLWGRGRTPVAAVLFGRFAESEEGITYVRLRARMSLRYWLDLTLVPAFMASLILYTPWPRWLAAASIAALFSLSWLWHRYSAVLQASEMVYFVQRALENDTARILPLQAGSPEVISSNPEFAAQWEKFYKEHKGE